MNKALALVNFDDRYNKNQITANYLKLKFGLNIKYAKNSFLTPSFTKTE